MRFLPVEIVKEAPVICASVVAGCDSAPVFQSTEHNLDPVAPFVAPFAVADGFSTRLPARTMLFRTRDLLVRQRTQLSRCP